MGLIFGNYVSFGKIDGDTRIFTFVTVRVAGMEPCLEMKHLHSVLQLKCHEILWGTCSYRV